MRSILLGVVAGLVALALAVGFIAANIPAERPARPTATPVAVMPSPASSATPSPAATTVSPSESATATATPSASDGGSSVGPTPSIGLRIGDQAPALAVAQLGGGRIDTGALAGTPLWINFTATWCPTCRDELPLLARAQAELDDRIAVLVIDVKEDPDIVASLAKELNLTLPIGLDGDGAAQRNWRAFALPVHYWIDADGVVRGVTYGGPPPDELLAGIRTVVPDASLRP